MTPIMCMDCGLYCHDGACRNPQCRLYVKHPFITQAAPVSAAEADEFDERMKLLIETVKAQ